jgi:NhaP-type Na+/H+ and K+/H+ antiporter
VDGWNDTENEYSFLYGFNCQSTSSSSGKAMAYSLLVKCLTLKDTLLVTLLANSGSQDPETIELDIMAYAVPEGVDSANTAAILSAVGQFTKLQELVDRVQAALESQVAHADSAYIFAGFLF